MKRHFYAVIILGALHFLSCQEKQNNISTTEQENKSVQKFELNDELITFNTTINDTIQAKVILETGCRDLQVDKSFFDKYLNTGQTKEPKVFQMGFRSSLEEIDTGYVVKSFPIKIKIGEKHITCNEFLVFDFKKKKIESDMLIPIPIDDSLVVWELNMKKKYIKLHDYNEGIVPEGYNYSKMYTGLKNQIPNHILFDLPIKYLSSNKEFIQDTLFCLFDTGNPMDIFLWNSIHAIEKLKKQKLSNGIMNDRNVKIFRTKASFFNLDIQDTTSLKFYKDPLHIPYSDIVGMNFIVRFNYFIDLHNKKLYYKQIKNPAHFFYRDGYSIGGGYAHYDTESNLVIDSIGEEYANDACAQAGIKDGDTIIWFCGFSVKEQTEKLKDFRDIIHNYDCYHFKVKRNGDTLDLKANKGF